MKRKSGWYWVLDSGQWVVAEYVGSEHYPWFVSGEVRAFGEHYWTNVDERRIVRTEPEASV